MTELREFPVIEFRDGPRSVPDYLAILMKDLPTHRLTYDQSVTAANKRLESDLLNAKQDDVIATHFRELR